MRDPTHWQGKIKQNKTHQPFCGDGPHDRVSGQQGGFGPIPQLFVGASLEQGAQTILAHREVV